MYTATYEDFTIVFDYEFQPFEKATLEYPGCEERLDIHLKAVKETESGEPIDFMMLDRDIKQEMIEACVAELEKQREESFSL